MYRKILCLLLALAMILLVFAGCAGGGAAVDGETAEEEDSVSISSGEGKKIALLLQHKTFKRYEYGDIPAFEETCREYGYEPIVQAAQDDSEKQIRQAESVLLQGVSAIILQPLNFKAAATIVEMAEEEGVPVISYNEMLTGARIDGYCGRDGFGLGYNSAQEMMKLYPDGNYIIVGGDEGAGAARDMIEGYHAALAENDNITVVSEQFNTGWASEGGLAQVEGALIANNDEVVAILANNDGLANGALQALTAVGLNGSVGLCGQDLELPAAKSIVSGDMSFTAFTDYKQMASDAVKMAVAIIEGRDLPGHTVIETEFGDVPYIETKVIYVYQSNMDEFLAEYPWWMTPEEVYGDTEE